MENVKEPKIKIYVSCHKKSYIPDNKLLYPIQVGAALADKKLSGMLYDDEGDNISEKNKQYCELTAQYWAWKNDTDADYYGFFHYRRYFNFNLKEIEEDNWGNIEYKNPIDKEILKELMLYEKWMRNIIEQYDVIVPKKRKLSVEQNNVYKQYATSIGQHEDDFARVIELLIKKYPEYYKTCMDYLASDEVYECNMFIMKKKLFFEYQEWLWDILIDLEKVSDLSDYSEVELRAPAYLGERLFAIWYIHNQEKRKWKTLELQKTLFRNTDIQQDIVNTKKESVKIVLSSNNQYVPYLAVTLQSIIENSSSNRIYEVFILTRDIKEDNKEKLQSAIKYIKNISLKFIDISQYVKKEFFVNQHISIETYYRLFILDLFKETSKILYLDCDMVVNKDVSILYDININNYYLAAVKDIDVAGTRKIDKETEIYISEEIGCNDKHIYFQAGVILMNLDLIRSKYSVSDLVKIALQREWRYWDQDVLNYTFKEKVYYIPQEWNVLMLWRENGRSRLDAIKMSPYTLYKEYLTARKDPLIVHYAGYQKPWNVPQCDFADYFWRYARNTSYYEILLNRMELKKCENVNTVQYIQAENDLVKQVDNQGIKIKSIDEPIYVDGVMIKVINKFNKKYPIGSKRRDRLRKLVKKFVR